MISNERVKVLQESSDLTTENPELWELASEATLTPTDSATTLNHLKEVMLDDFPAPPETSYTVITSTTAWQIILLRHFT